jgi:uncharacterized membrane protein YphA (DoxX/SURF4 family)
MLSSAVRWLAAVVLVVHGLIHLLGAVKGLGWGDVEQLKEPISTPLGVAWLVAAVAVTAAGVLLAVGRPTWWWALAGGAAVLSQALVVTAWGDAKAGTVANVVLVVAAVLGFASQGPGSLHAQWRAEAREALAAVPSGAPLLTRADLAGVPPQVASYVERSGAVGRPRVHGFLPDIHGRIRSGPDDPWMDFRGHQVNTYGERPRRLFAIDATMKGIPATVVHDYGDGHATMRGKALGLVPVVGASGAVMVHGETVTVLNDLVFFAPGALPFAPVEWQVLDERRVRATMRAYGEEVSATLVFDAAGDLVDFVSDDRSRAGDHGSFEPMRWSTPIDHYREVRGHHVATSGEGVWHAPAPDGTYSYIEFAIDDLRYDVTPELVPTR